MLTTATSGVREGAQAINQATGAGAKVDDLLKSLTGGSSSADLVSQAKDLIQNNKVAAGTLAGMLGGLMLGTQTGRSLTWDAAKIGGMVLIGGLAYKAYKNHQAGKSILGAGAGGSTRRFGFRHAIADRRQRAAVRAGDDRGGGVRRAHRRP